MAITVKFFASLRERMGCAETTVDAQQASTAAGVWRLAAGDEPAPGNLLVAINMEYATLESAVQDGDEVAFFSPVTGGAHEG